VIDKPEDPRLSYFKSIIEMMTGRWEPSIIPGALGGKMDPDYKPQSSFTEDQSRARLALAAAL
jgi:hypothetical protein